MFFIMIVLLNDYVLNANSTVLATLNNETSENGAEFNIIPTGKPSDVNPAGKEIAQSPNKLAIIVFRRAIIFACANASGDLTISASLGGLKPTVGIITAMLPDARFKKLSVK